MNDIETENEYFDQEIQFCEVCNGTLNMLGMLGQSAHYNCQQCGMETSITFNQGESNE